MLLTEGSISKKIIKFALPVFWGNLFQQLYHIVDSLILGNFVGKEALAAVSASGPVIFLLVGLFGGIFVGAGVVISKLYGAGDEKKVSLAVHTSVLFGIICGVVMLVLGSFLSPYILVWIHTPDDVMDLSLIYFKIFFQGIIFIVLYNTLSGIFQAVGDSRHPLYYLMVSSVLNVVLDLLFVVSFNWGIAGAAIATVISQAVSVILALIRLLRVDDVYRLQIKKLKIDPLLLKQILYLGIPSGIQNSVIALANVFVQSSINVFDTVAIAGAGASSRIEGFVFIPITSFVLAMTTFIGQNLGAREFDRAKKGAKFGIITVVILAELIGILNFLLAPKLIALFNQDPGVIAVGTQKARIVAFFYCFLACSHCIAAILRGAGKPIVPMMVMLLCWCVIRVSYIKIITHYIFEINVVFWAYPITWCLSTIIFIIYYRKSDWVHNFQNSKYLA